MTRPPSAFATDVTNDERRTFFEGRQGDRYWWHRVTGNAYVPDVYAQLSPAEWQVLKDWFIDTDERLMIGECSVPLIGWLTSFVSSNNVSRIVQLGTYVGYSTLLLGWTLKRMGKRRGLMTVDVDPVATAYTESWLDRAELRGIVEQHLGDSADPELPALAEEILGGPPQLVFIDSSHQYAHTLQELNLWYDAIVPGAIMAMHDVSEFAAAFDPTGKGGVHRALSEWSANHPGATFSLAFPSVSREGHLPTYIDGCGLGVVLKR